MKKASKFLTLLLVAVLVLSIFSGCSLFGRNTEKYRAQTAITVGNENITIGKLIDTYNNYYNSYSSYIGTYVTLEDVFEMAVSALYEQYLKIDAYKTSNPQTYTHAWLGDLSVHNGEYLTDTELQYGVSYIKYILFSTLDTMVESYIDSDYTLQEATEETEDTSRDFYEFDDLEGASTYSDYMFAQTFVNEEMDEYISNYYEGIIKNDTLVYGEYVYDVANAAQISGLTKKIAELNERIEDSDPIDAAKYVEYQSQALKQYEKNVLISYDYSLESLIARQLEDYVNSTIVAKYNYSVYGAIDGANLAETLQQLKTNVVEATASQKTDFKINSNFVSFIEGLTDDSHVYYVPENYKYIYVKNILIPYTTEQKTILGNLEAQQGSATTPEYLAKCKEFAAQIVADDFFSEKDEDGNYEKVSNLFTLDANGELVINLSNSEFGKYFDANGKVVPAEGKTATETILDLMARFNTDTASHTSLHDYVVRVGEVPESYTAPWVTEFVDAANDAYNAANGVAGTTYGIAISTYGVHVVFYSADVVAETFDFDANWLNTSTSEYRLFKSYFTTQSDTLIEEAIDALKDSYYAGKIKKTDAFDKFLKENEIEFDFEESISLDEEDE